MSGWTIKDTAKFSNDSAKDAARAEHDCREAATKAGLFERGNSEKNSKPFPKDDSTGREAQSFFSSLFGKKK